MSASLSPTHGPATGSAATVQEVVSPAGVRAYLITDRSLPFLSMAFRLRAGAVYDPAGKAGLAVMAAGLLDEGAGELDSQAFHALIEDNAIRLSFDADRDSLSGSLKTLNGTRDLAFDLLRRAMYEPRFDAEPVERVRSQILANLKRLETNPQAVASRSWFAHAFAGHPYARPTSGTPDEVAGIVPDDLRSYVRARLGRADLAIGVAGDIGPEELAALLDRSFAGLPGRAELPAVPRITPAADDTIVVQMSLPQSVVTFGHAGIGLADPDYYAAFVANYVLGGGGFSSRLMQEVREARGLAYSVNSSLYHLDYAPIWQGGVATRNDQVAQSIAIVKAEAARLAMGEVDATDLEHAKTYLTGSFPLRLTSNDQLARMLVAMMAYDLGADYLTARNRHIEAVGLEDLRRAADRLLTGPMLVSVVGAPVGLDA